MTTAESTMIGRLKLVRKELDLTQREFASGADLSYGLIIGIEQGMRNITDKTIRKICDAYSINEDWLQYGEGLMFADDHENAADNRRDVFNLFVRVFNLNADKQKQLAALADYPIDMADVYSRDSESANAAKRNVARLVKAIERGSVGRV